ncbi:hypothetical protein UY3_13636 [Chelonia mydas]|uniref:Myb/SANT-like DNA-binding domain-containing protein n=1 Tax=Chelonia mydas TaxID=8469 RepID=M7AUZ0_CHEMY|nr:hypothetical protein UY3_13636 [Chelonia mydas]
MLAALLTAPIGLERRTSCNRPNLQTRQTCLLQAPGKNIPHSEHLAALPVTDHFYPAPLACQLQYSQTSLPYGPHTGEDIIFLTPPLRLHSQRPLFFPFATAQCSCGNCNGFSESEKYWQTNTAAALKPVITSSDVPPLKSAVCDNPTFSAVIYPNHKCRIMKPEVSPCLENGEVLNFISVWGEEAVQSQLRSNRRNYDIFRQISRDMVEGGHDWDALQCRIKVKELWNAYRRAHEANSCPGAAPTTCHFYKELDAILGRDPTSSPRTTMDALEHSPTRQEEEEEQSRSEGAEEEEDTPASLDACSQELFSNQEEDLHWFSCAPVVLSEDATYADGRASPISVGLHSLQGKELEFLGPDAKPTEIYGNLSINFRGLYTGHDF